MEDTCKPIWTRPAPSVMEMRGIRFLTAPDDEATPGAPVDPPKPDGDKPLGDGGEKALKAERAARSAAERRVAELEAEAQKRADAELTEVERLKKENATLTEQNAKSERDALRNAVALEKGLPASLAARLIGSTREEMAADADTLLSVIPQAQSTNPRPDPSQGPKSTPSGGSVDAGAARYREKHPPKK
ncbi:capsid assembly scaffolding protein Gp46 family protein [Rathayibacter sp. VKM Ac-2630]|uniref:capsid assembly scaffolding protein Gp46 family protein n=1 Tax=Rathayibacter sp. VKM Ac-2630 TaxID=1938617 RepID=UPI001115A562|nr:DUF4355 domain-containing protein [Rathayibacter sp. VKM Ac-2630]